MTDSWRRNGPAAAEIQYKLDARTISCMVSDEVHNNQDK